jgi:hypothetical protein
MDSLNKNQVYTPYMGVSGVIYTTPWQNIYTQKISGEREFLYFSLR